MQKHTFQPTHYITINNKHVLVQLLHRTTFRQGATVKRNAVCYVCDKGEVTTRGEAEFNRLFTAIEHVKRD